MSHDIEKQCRKIPGLKNEKLELRKGIATANLFNEICKMHGKNDEHIRTYLLKFELAVELKDGDLFIPAIVSEKNEVRHFFIRLI